MIESRASELDAIRGIRQSIRGGVVQAEVDVEALAEWLLAGIELFVGEGLPSRQAVDDAAFRVAMLAALRRTGTISGAAAALGTSRRALRDGMKRMGLYERWQSDRASVPSGSELEGDAHPVANPAPSSSSTGEDP